MDTRSLVPRHAPIPASAPAISDGLESFFFLWFADRLPAPTHTEQLEQADLLPERPHETSAKPQGEADRSRSALAVYLTACSQGGGPRVGHIEEERRPKMHNAYVLLEPSPCSAED